MQNEGGVAEWREVTRSSRRSPAPVLCLIVCIAMNNSNTLTRQGTVSVKSNSWYWDCYRKIDTPWLSIIWSSVSCSGRTVHVSLEETLIDWYWEKHIWIHEAFAKAAKISKRRFPHISQSTCSRAVRGRTAVLRWLGPRKQLISGRLFKQWYNSTHQMF